MPKVTRPDKADESSDLSLYQDECTNFYQDSNITGLYLHGKALLVTLAVRAIKIKRFLFPKMEITTSVLASLCFKRLF